MAGNLDKALQCLSRMFIGTYVSKAKKFVREGSFTADTVVGGVIHELGCDEYVTSPRNTAERMKVVLKCVWEALQEIAKTSGSTEFKAIAGSTIVQLAVSNYISLAKIPEALVLRVGFPAEADSKLSAYIKTITPAYAKGGEQPELEIVAVSIISGFLKQAKKVVDTRAKEGEDLLIRSRRAVATRHRVRQSMSSTSEVLDRVEKTLKNPDVAKKVREATDGKRTLSPVMKMVANTRQLLKEADSHVKRSDDFCDAVEEARKSTAEDVVVPVNDDELKIGKALEDAEKAADEAQEMVKQLKEFDGIFEKTSRSSSPVFDKIKGWFKKIFN